MVEIKNSDFTSFNFRVGKIKAVQEHSNKAHYVALVDLGSYGSDKQIVLKLKESYSFDELVGKQVIVLVNAAPIDVEGTESIGFVLTTHHNGKKVLIEPQGDLTLGSPVDGMASTEYKYQE